MRVQARIRLLSERPVDGRFILFELPSKTIQPLYPSSAEDLDTLVDYEVVIDRGLGTKHYGKFSKEDGRYYLYVGKVT